MSDERFELQIATAAGYYPGEASSDTLTFNEVTEAPNKVEDYLLVKRENYPKELTVKLWNRDGNLVGGTYSAATGSGSLVTGLQVDFYDYPTSTGTKTLQFHGKIAQVTQEDMGLIEIVCVSELRNLQELYRETFYADVYREEYQVQQREVAWPLSFDGDTDWVAPPLMAEAVLKKEQAVYAEVADDYHNITTSLTYIAQPFPGRSNWIDMVYLKLKGGATNTAKIMVGLMKLDPATGFPDNTFIAWQEFGPYSDAVDHYVWFTPDLDTIGDYLRWTDKLDTSTGCAIVVVASGDTSTVDIYVGTVVGKVGPPKTTTWTPHAQSYSGTWSEEKYSFAPFKVYYSDWVEMDLDEAYDAPVGNIGFVGLGMRDRTPDGDSSTHLKRGCATYFYGTVDVHVVMENLISFGCASYAVDNAGGGTVGIYRTSGKPMLECVNQLCDRFSVGSVRDQATVFDNYNASTHVASVYVLDKYNTTTDTAVVAFSDTGADGPKRIVECALKKSSGLAINTVEVVGESGKKPVFASSVDWASRALIGPVVHKVTDKNFATFSECFSEARRIMDAINRTDWEGEITVAGCWSDLMDHTAGASGTVKGGKIIELTISTLHISAAKFKVRSVTTVPGKSIIAVTNYDFTKEQVLELRRGRSLMFENFTANLDAIKEVFVPVRNAAAVTTATLYMELQTAAGAALAGQTRILCTKSADDIYNIYHATFEPMNAWTVSGTKCGRIALYTAASGGSRTTYVDLTAAEQFYKLKVSRASIDMFCDQT